jgi:hypothetical protein
VITRNYKRPLDTEWYFKNGVYNTSSGSKAQFKNFRFFEAPGSESARERGGSEKSSATK